VRNLGDIGDIKGHHKVAALLLSLDPSTRAAVLGKMNEDVLERVAVAMMELDPRLTGVGVVELLKDALARDVHGVKTVRPCKEADLAQVLGQSLGRQKGDKVLEGILARRRKARPFQAIESLNPLDVGRVLRQESNAVTALVLGHLDPALSARILVVFEDEQAIDVVKRMATLDPPSSAVVEGIAAELYRKVRELPEATGISDPAERLKAVADLLNNSRPEMEKGVIQSLAEDDVDMAQELREYLFTWTDIATIDTRTMQKILGTVDTKTLSIALKGCSPEVEENITGNLSSRVKEMVKEERELAGPLPMTEVEAARGDIMRNIRAMIEAGEFRPTKGGEELVA